MSWLAVDMKCLKVSSDRKQWTQWMPQDYKQSQCKTWSDANIQCGVHHLHRLHCLHHLITQSWKHRNIAWCYAAAANRCWHSPDPDDTDVAGICWTDFESEMTVKATIAVCECHGAPTTRLYTAQDYLLNTDMMSLSFPTFLGLPQVILCRDDD